MADVMTPTRPTANEEELAEETGAHDSPRVNSEQAPISSESESTHPVASPAAHLSESTFAPAPSSDSSEDVGGGFSSSGCPLARISSLVSLVMSPPAALQPVVSTAVALAGGYTLWNLRTTEEVLALHLAYVAVVAAALIGIAHRAGVLQRIATKQVSWHTLAHTRWKSNL